MKNLTIFSYEIFFLNLIFLRKTRKSISSFVICILLIINLEIITKEFLILVDLFKA